MASATQKNMQKIETDLKRLQADIVNLTKAVSGDVENGVDSFAKAADEHLDEAATYARVLGAEGKEKVSNTVTSNPLASLAAAAGIGFVIGAVLRR